MLTRVAAQVVLAVIVTGVIVLMVRVPSATAIVTATGAVLVGTTTVLSYLERRSSDRD